MSTENQELAVTQGVLDQSLFIKPVASLEQISERYKVMNEFIKGLMEVDLDYGKIPGAGEKPTLLKPGAEKLCTLFGLTVDQVLDHAVEDWTGKDHNGEPFFYYRYKAIIKRNGVFVASTDGSANSWEKKHRYRTAEPVCPECGASAIKRSKYPDRNSGDLGWYCYDKIGGCKATFHSADKRITDQPKGNILNDNPADLVNTLQKMAQKRSMIAGVLVACNASSYFTQDIEDMDFGGIKVSTPKRQVDEATGEIIDGEITEIKKQEAKQEVKQPVKQPAKQESKPDFYPVNPEVDQNVVLSPEKKSDPVKIKEKTDQAKALVDYRKMCFKLNISTREAEAILHDDYDGNAIKALEFLKKSIENN